MTDASWQILTGDCIDLMRELPDASIDACVTDPPYALPGGFMGKPWDRYEGREDAGFAYYLSGLIDGEGCFRVGPEERRCEFSIKLRRDDVAILGRARDFIGHGRISMEPQRGGSRPQARWVIDTKDGCAAMVGYLAKYPLRARKRVDAGIWADAVGEWLTQERGNRWHGPADRAALRALGASIKRGREYREVPWSGHRFQDWCREWADEALRVLKPGGHLLAFGGTRTYHRLACAVEDAGFEIRDSLMWIQGSGFPKSLDVSKAIDRGAGVEREDVYDDREPVTGNEVYGEGLGRSVVERRPVTPQAQQWEGWGTALKPSYEPVVVARKPLVGTVARNVVEFGTGALNVDGCRIASGGPSPSEARRESARRSGNAPGRPGEYRDTLEDRTSPERYMEGRPGEALGRWPANVLVSHADGCQQTGTRKVRSGDSTQGVVHGTGDGATFLPVKEPGAHYAGADGLEELPAWECVEGCPVADLDAQSGSTRSTVGRPRGAAPGNGWGMSATGAEYEDSGGASRFFATFQRHEEEEWPYPSGTANTAANLSCQSSARDGSVPSGAATPASREATSPSDSRTPCPAHSTTATPSVSGQPPASDTPPIQPSSSPAVLPDARTPNLDRVSAAVPSAPTGTTTTTSERQMCDGSVAPVTSGSTPPNAGHGEPGLLASEPRFRYTAKASSAERNAGLDGFEVKSRAELTGRAEGSAGLQHPRAMQRAARANVHPTVKPLDVMRWLVRLVTPPNGLVLDPFAGSGTTGCAAVIEGFRFLGVEREAEYVPIAEARVWWWSQWPVGLSTAECLRRDAQRRGVEVEAEERRREREGAGQLDILSLLEGEDAA